MDTGRRISVLGLVAILLAACTVPDLPTAGRPCSVDAPCGPGTTCSPSEGICRPGAVSPDAGVDLRRLDQLVTDQRAGDARADIFVIIADAFVAPGVWKTLSPGAFTMGSPPSEACRRGPDAGPPFVKETAHKVTLTHGFAISVKEVMVQDYIAIMGYTSPRGGHIYHPATSLRWHAAVAYCNELSAGAGLTRCYVNAGSGQHCKANQFGNCPLEEYCVIKHQACYRFTSAPAFSGAKIYTCPGYRLPTEAEWEYAYRAGTTTPLYNGKSLDPTACSTCFNSQPNADQIAWYCGNGNSIHVGGPPKPPNAWGLYNMAGNVKEWIHDPYQADLGSSPVVDPVGVGPNSTRVLRGASYLSTAPWTRAAARWLSATMSPQWGVRCVRSINP
jgi:formylglycine-generating enzyme required for sulfatase activity